MEKMNLLDKAEFLREYANAIVAKYTVYIAKNKIAIADTENEYRVRCDRAVALKDKALYIKSEDEYNEILAELEKLKEAFENGK